MATFDLKDVYKAMSDEMRKGLAQRMIGNLSLMRGHPDTRTRLQKFRDRLRWQWQALRLWLGEKIAGRKFDDGDW